MGVVPFFYSIPYAELSGVESGPLNGSAPKGREESMHIEAVARVIRRPFGSCK
jgi:hypothetical protein